MHNIFVVFLICTGQYVLAIRIQNLPCFTDESLKDLEEARKELTTVDNYIEKTVKILADEFQKTLNSMKSQLVTMQTNVNKIVQKVDTDLILMSKDLEGQWTKYQGHCYHFSSKRNPWYEAERLCRDYNGYLVKIENSTENEWLHSNIPNKGDGYWIGLTDLIEGEWRWSVDQSLASLQLGVVFLVQEDIHMIVFVFTQIKSNGMTLTAKSTFTLSVKEIFVKEQLWSDVREEIYQLLIKDELFTLKFK